LLNHSVSEVGNDSETDFVLQNSSDIDSVSESNYNEEPLRVWVFSIAWQSIGLTWYIESVWHNETQK
jgi:hypothetical protein